MRFHKLQRELESFFFHQKVTIFFYYLKPTEERAEKQIEKEHEEMLKKEQLKLSETEPETSNRKFKAASTRMMNQRRSLKLLGVDLDSSVTAEESNGPSRTSSLVDDQGGYKDVNKQATKSRANKQERQHSFPQLTQENEQKIKKRDGASSEYEEESDWGPMVEQRDVIQQRIKQRLRKDVEILVRKLAEIQYEDEQRRSEEELRSVLERVSKARQRAQPIDSVAAELKNRLYAEREFGKTELLSEPQLALPAAPGTFLSVGKFSSTHSDANMKSQLEEFQKRHDKVTQELQKQKEERTKTEKMLSDHQQLIEELRKNMRAQTQFIIQEQKKRYDELKDLILNSTSREHKRSLIPSTSDQAYISLDGSSHSSLHDRDAAEEDRNVDNSDEENILRDQNAPRKRPQRRRPEQRARQGRKYWESPGDRNSPRNTPHFYIQ